MNQKKVVQTKVQQFRDGTARTSWDAEEAFILILQYDRTIKPYGQTVLEFMPNANVISHPTNTTSTTNHFITSSKRVVVHE